MDTNKMMPEAMKSEFDAAFRQVFGFGAAEAIAAKDDTAMAIMGAAAWAWQASREAVVVELQEPDLPEAYIDEPVDRESEEFRYLEARHGAQCQTYRKCRQAIEAQGLRVAP